MLSSPSLYELLRDGTPSGCKMSHCWQKWYRALSCTVLCSAILNHLVHVPIHPLCTERADYAYPSERVLMHAFASLPQC